MDTQITILNQSRQLILRKIEGLSFTQLQQIPDGFNNNILWNVAHLAVTQQLLCYRFSNLETYISEEWVEKYKKGTKPSELVSEQEWEAIKEKFIQLPKQFKKDVDSNKFIEYKAYTTSMDVTLTSIQEALSYNMHHEGIHLGTILQLLKFV